MKRREGEDRVLTVVPIVGGTKVTRKEKLAQCSVLFLVFFFNLEFLIMPLWRCVGRECVSAVPRETRRGRQIPPELESYMNIENKRRVLARAARCLDH